MRIATLVLTATLLALACSPVKRGPGYEKPVLERESIAACAVCTPGILEYACCSAGIGECPRCEEQVGPGGCCNPERVRCGRCGSPMAVLDCCS